MVGVGCSLSAYKGSEAVLTHMAPHGPFPNGALLVVPAFSYKDRENLSAVLVGIQSGGLQSRATELDPAHNSLDWGPTVYGLTNLETYSPSIYRFATPPPNHLLQKI